MKDVKPAGREAVEAALVEAAIALVAERGIGVSVRQIAQRAGVNHGLVHIYFGSKDGLLGAAFDEVNRRAAADVDDRGFPPADAAQRRNGELGKIIARMQLDAGKNLFRSHPMAASWRDALSREEPELDRRSIDSMVAKAAVFALGWSVFGEHLCDTLNLDQDRRVELAAEVHALVAEMGGLPVEEVAGGGPAFNSSTAARNDALE